MRKRFASLSILVILAGGAVLLARGGWARQDAADAVGVQTAAAEDTHAGTASGDVLMDSARAQLSRHRSIRARLRFQIELYGQQLFGHGTYLQQGLNSDRRMRVELAVQGGERTTSAVHVSDGDRLWMFEDVAIPVQLQFVDLSAVRSAMTEQVGPRAPPSAQALALGGLPGMLTNLQRNFRFQSAQQARWNDLPVWVLRGAWRPDRLARLLDVEVDKAFQQAAGERRLPASVTLFLDAESLFPYRVEYRHPAEYPEAGGAAAEAPFFQVELFEVQFNTEVDPQRFSRPSNLPSVDVTKGYLQRMGLATADGH